MARVVKRLEDAQWYVLDLPGDDGASNRDDPDPFRVLILPISGEEMMRLEQQAVGSMTRGGRNVARASAKMRERIIRERVIEVAGYAVFNKKTGATFRPRNGDELLKAVAMAGAREPDLVLEEIMEALRDHSKLETGLPEGLTSRSERCSPEIARSQDGDAGNAGEKSAPAPSSLSGSGGGYATATA